MNRIQCVTASVAMSLLVFQGCTTTAPASVRSVDKTTLDRLINSDKPLKRIVILPFTGQSPLSKLSGEQFAILLRKHHQIETIGPAPATDNITEVDAVIFGRLSEVKGVGVTVSVTVIDTQTDGVILHTATPCAGPINVSAGDLESEQWREAVMQSTQAAAYDVIAMLHLLDGYSWSRPVEGQLFTEAE